MAVRKISTTTEGFYSYGTIEEIVALLKESGFTAYDCSLVNGKGYERFIENDDYLSQAQALRSFADSISLPCNQTHAPFPSARVGDDVFNAAAFAKNIRALEVSGILGAKVCVVHPCNNYTAEENAKKVYLPLAPYARKYGVKIGVENMWNYSEKDKCMCDAACSSPKDFLAHMQLLPSDVFVANIDIGHAELKGLNTSAPEMIRALGGYFQAMHLHDVNFREDSHTLPFVENINFEEVITALKEVSYTGDITLETIRFVQKMPVELIPAAAKMMAAVAEYFQKRLDE